MGSSSASSTQTSNRDPWAPTLPFLKDFIGALRGEFAGGWQPNQHENNAISQMMQNARQYNGFGDQARNMTARFLGGDPNRMLGRAYGEYQQNMTPLAEADLDPTKTPGMANVLSTIQNDIGNNVNGMFAGAGRDMSGMHMQALSRGMSQGMAAPLLNQYNQNVSQRMSANSGLLGAAGGTSTAMGNNKQTGLNMAQMLPSLINQPQQMQLQASGMQRNLPLQNLAQIEAMLLPLAQLGGQGVQRSWSEQTPSAMSQIQQGLAIGGQVAALGGGFAGMGGGGLSGGMNPLGGFTGNYFPGNPAAAGAGYGQYGGSYFPMFG